MDSTVPAGAATPAAKLTPDAFAQQRLDLLKKAGVDTSKVTVDPKVAPAEQWRKVSEALMPGLTEQAQQAGFSHVLDWVEKGAADSGKLPAAGSRTAGAYVKPTEQRKALEATLKAKGLDDAAIKAKVHGQAEGYAKGRIGELRRVEAKIGDTNLTSLLADEKADPVAIWATASKRLSELADEAGYSDPRVYLRTLLQAKAGQAAATTPVPDSTIDSTTPATAPATAAPPVTAANSPAHTGA